MKKTAKNQTGYMLVEILISLFIIGVIFVLYNGAVSSVFLTTNANHQEIALRIADSEIETLRATPYNLLPASGNFNNPLLASLPSGQASLTMTQYNGSTQQVDVTVSWNERGATHAIGLSTLITKIGGLK